jgi:hypothetical protein
LLKLASEGSWSVQPWPIPCASAGTGPIATAAIAARRIVVSLMGRVSLPGNGIAIARITSLTINRPA